LPDAIVIRGVTKTFGTKVAVSNLDLTVHEGALCGFIGPNGAGKTTAIRMIMSILFPDRGEISVLGRASALESKDRIGYLPEERGLYRKMRVGAFLKFIGHLKGVDSATLSRRVPEWLARVQLADVARKRCEELSKGMQQKVQFLAAIIHDPELVILDEPFSGLDPVNRRLLREMIDELHQRGRTVILSTHVMFEAEQLCTQIFMINRGVKVLDASLEEIRARFDPKALLVEPLGGNGELGDGAAAVRSVSGVHGVHAARGHLELKLDDRADVTQVMSDVAARLPVRRLELKRPSLEDIFIELVGGSDAALRAELENEGVISGAGAQEGRLA
jgi:ABC-2 type transport system ATP-binding protein